MDGTGTGLRRPPRRLDALLFDLDGTLVDTDLLHFEASVAALGKFGKGIDRGRYDAVIHGGANDDIRRALFPEDPDGLGHDYVALKESLFRESVGSLEPLPGLLPLLDRTVRRNLKTAVVTNAPRANAELMLGAIGLGDHFDAVLICDEMPVGKPDPEPYREAMRQLGCTPETALGFEDSPHGLTALSGAGVFSVALAAGGAPEVQRAAGADIIVDDFQSPELLALLHPLLEGTGT